MLWDYPIPLGNMQLGTVVEMHASCRSLRLGDRVFFSGGFQPVSAVSEHEAWVLEPGMPWKAALLLDPAEFALGAVRDAGLRFGDRAAVFGMGAIGLVAVQLARAAGAGFVAAIDPLPNRREAAQACGADLVLDPKGQDVGLRLREATEGMGVDVAIEFSGSTDALQAAIRGVGYLGTIVCGAFPPPYGAGLDFGGEAHMNRPRIVFSRACSDPSPDHPRWDHRRIQRACYQAIRRGLLDGEPVIGPIVRFEDLLDEYPLIANQPDRAIKLGVRYPGFEQ